MEDPNIAAVTPSMARAMAPGLSAALGTLVSGRQDRKNLEADRAIVEGMMQRGLTNFRYRGIAMDFEAFAEAQQEETERLVANFSNAMLKADSIVDWSKVDLDQFNPEFRRRWIFEASNVSEETLQDLWARLLVGELESPGSVSNDTMSIARDLNMERAKDFQTICSAALCSLDGTPLVVVGCGNPGANSLQPYGLSYDVLMRLAHHRLIINDMTSYVTLNMGASRPMLPVQQQDHIWLLQRTNGTGQTDASYRISGILFTPAGKELSAVVEKIPDLAYTEAMLKSLQQEGWAVIPLAKAS